MAIRIRKVKNEKAIGGFGCIALCAAENKHQKGDLYLNDGIHEALDEKFHADYVKMGFIKKDNK